MFSVGEVSLFIFRLLKKDPLSFSEKRKSEKCMAISVAHGPQLELHCYSWKEMDKQTDRAKKGWEARVEYTRARGFPFPQSPSV